MNDSPDGGAARRRLSLPIHAHFTRHARPFFSHPDLACPAPCGRKGEKSQPAEGETIWYDNCTTVAVSGFPDHHNTRNVFWRLRLNFPFSTLRTSFGGARGSSSCRS